MKIAAKRSGISQSMDLFIIIAAVLAVGGVVTAAIYGLANSATQNSSLQIVSATVHPGTVGATIAVKDNGGSSLASATPSTSITGATGGTPAVTCAPTACPTTLSPGTQEILTFSGYTGSLTAGSTVSVTVSWGSATQTIQVIVSQS
jgi:hypothetical protein